MGLDREQLRMTFDEDAPLYDRARPPYPPQAVADLTREARLGPGARVLEIGCGTGIFTEALAERGLKVTAVEIGEHMAAAARRRLATYADVEIAVCAFEEYDLPPERFDLVVAATSFHWVDPAVRVEKSADALRPGGALAILQTTDVAGEDGRFVAESQDCYLRYDPDVKLGFRLPTSEELPREMAELDCSPRFAKVALRRYLWKRTYSAAAYRDLLRTYSAVRALGERGERLADCVESLVNARFGGSITKQLLTELRIATTPKDA